MSAKIQRYFYDVTCGWSLAEVSRLEDVRLALEAVEAEAPPADDLVRLLLVVAVVGVFRVGVNELGSDSKRYLSQQEIQDSHQKI